METPIEQTGKGISSNQALQELRKKQSTSFAVNKEQQESRRVLLDMIFKVENLEEENRILRAKLEQIKVLLSE